VPLILEHGNITWSSTVCRLLLSSKSVEQAAQSCKMPCIEFQIMAGREGALERVSGFARWLKQYIHSVGKLKFSSWGSASAGTTTACQTMLSFALEAGAAGPVRA
jgi:hypothetical protein